MTTKNIVVLIGVAAFLLGPLVYWRLRKNGPAVGIFPVIDFLRKLGAVALFACIWWLNLPYWLAFVGLGVYVLSGWLCFAYLNKLREQQSSTRSLER